MHLIARQLYFAPFAAVILSVFTVSAWAYDGRTVDQEISTDGAHSVQIKQRIGDLVIRGGGGDSMRVEVQVRCAGSGTPDCRHAAAKVRIDWGRKGSRLEVRIIGTSRLSSRHIRITTTVKMPDTLPLETDTAIGNVTISDLKSDIEVDIGEGDAELTLKKKVVRRINLDVGVGDARIVLAGTQINDSGKVLDAVDWSNPEGKTLVEVDVGIGDAVVTLE